MPNFYVKTKQHMLGIMWLECSTDCIMLTTWLLTRKNLIFLLLLHISEGVNRVGYKLYWKSIRIFDENDGVRSRRVQRPILYLIWLVSGCENFRLLYIMSGQNWSNILKDLICRHMLSPSFDLCTGTTWDLERGSTALRMYDAEFWKRTRMQPAKYCV